MHRNTFIVILFLGIFAALVVGVNLGRSTVSQMQNQTPPLSPTPSVVVTPTPTLLSYSSSLCGISFTYPDNVAKVDIETGGVTLANEKNPDESIVVICQKNIPRVPLPKDEIETVKIGSVSANLYHDASQKDGKPIDKLIFTHPKLKQDIYIAGTGTLFQTVIDSLRITL